MCLLSTRVASIFLQIRSWWAHNASTPFSISFVPTLQKYNGINFHITIATVANAFLTYGNQLLLAHNNPTELSSYSLAFQMMMVVFLFQGQAIRLSNRSIMEACRSRKALLQSIAHNAGVLFAGSTILACGAWIVIQILPHVLADARFVDMSKIALPLCIWVVIAAGRIFYFTAQSCLRARTVLPIHFIGWRMYRAVPWFVVHSFLWSISRSGDTVNCPQ